MLSVPGNRALIVSYGIEYKGIKARNGALFVVVFAFYPNKQITTGEGGMIVTDDDRIAYLCRSMCNQGRGEGGLWLTHERLGYNYRMDELSAALGVAQMSRIEEIIAKRQRVVDMYAERLSKIPGEGDFPITELAGRTSIAIPFHNNLTKEEVDYVAEVLEEALRTA